MQILVALSLATGSLACIGGLLGGGGGGGCCPSAVPSCGNPCGPRPVVGYAAAPPLPAPAPPPVEPANAYPVAPQQFPSPPLAVPPPPPPHPSPFPAAPLFPPAPPPAPAPAPIAVQPIPFFGMTQQSHVSTGYATPLHQGFQQQVNAATGMNFVPSSLFGQQISSGFGQPSATNSYAQGLSGTAGYQAPSTFAQQAIAPVPEQRTFQQQQQVAVFTPQQQPDSYGARPTEQIAADQGSISNTGVGTAVEQPQAAAVGEYRAQVQQQVVQQQDIASGGTEVHYDDVQEPSNEETPAAQPAQPAPEPTPVQDQVAVAPVDPIQPQVVAARPQPYIQPAHIATHVIETVQHVAEPAQPHTVNVEEIVKTVKPVDPVPTFPPIPEVHQVVQTVQPVVQPSQPTPVAISRPVVQQVLTPVQPQPQPTPIVEVKQSIDNQEQIVSETTEGEEEQNYDDVEPVQQVVPQPRPVPQVQTPQVPVPQVAISQVAVHQPQPARPVPQISLPIVVTESKTPVQPYHPQVTQVEPAKTTSVVLQPTPVVNKFDSAVRITMKLAKVFKVDPVMPSPATIHELDNLLNPTPVTTTLAPIVEKKVHSGSLDFHQVTEELRTTPKARSTIPSATRFTTEAPVTIALPDSSESTNDKPSSSSSGSTEQQPQHASGENYDEELPETTTLKQVIPTKEVKPLETIPVAPAKIAVAPAQIPVVAAKTPVVAAKIEVEVATRASKVVATEAPTITTTTTTAAPTTTTTEIQSIDLGQSADYDEVPPHEETPHEERPEIPQPAESFNGAETTSAPEACAAGDPNCRVACKAGDAHCGQEELAQEIVEPEQNGFDYGDGPESHESKAVIVNSENEAKATGAEYPETKAAGTRQLASFPLKAASSLQPVDNYRRRRFNRA